MSLSPIDRARKIRLVLFDVDGVLTDGQIWIFPSSTPSSLTEGDAEHVANRVATSGGNALSSTHMVEVKGFSAHDGTGIALARIGGMQCGIITKRISESVALRARDLRLEFVYLGQAHKLKAVHEIMEKTGLTLEEIAFAGDDIVDLPVMRVCGLAIAVANARPQVKEAAHYVTSSPGGHGAGRDAIEFILGAKGILNECIEKCIDDRSPIPASMDIARGFSCRPESSPAGSGVCYPFGSEIDP